MKGTTLTTRLITDYVTDLTPAEFAAAKAANRRRVLRHTCGGGTQLVGPSPHDAFAATSLGEAA